MTAYNKLTYDGKKIQVDSAIRDGSGANIENNYLKSATASSTYLSKTDAATTYASLASPTFTGTITAPHFYNSSTSSSLDFIVGSIFSLTEVD